MENYGVNVDKKLLLSESLARILKNSLVPIRDVVQHHLRPEVRIKEDGSPVTELDEALSHYFYSYFTNHYSDFYFYSEENFKDWGFPLMALDPLDGTREYLEGNDEWAISIGLFETEKFNGEGWIYNPKKNELFDNNLPIRPFLEKASYLGEVSRSEWKKGLFTNKKSAKFDLRAVGSIAYKLGRLARGDSDYVVSLTPKNIWDVAGGTLLCKRAGFNFYSQGQLVTSVLPLYRPPLIWCHERLFSELSEIYL